ncbi:MAG: GNAT family N-acetyltransferase [Solobacterium sp.]|nr:GNAT family N-acetyltransferase [Solobacterium sp.]
MIIRRAEKKDIPRVIDLLHQVLTVHAKLRPDLFIEGTAKYSSEQLEAMLEDETRPFFVSEEDGKVIGYAMCEVLPPAESENMYAHRTLYLDDLCVDAAYRGKHAGKELYKAAAAYAKEIGCYHVTLNVWTGNREAERFYEAMGMTRMKTTMEQIL